MVVRVASVRENRTSQANKQSCRSSKNLASDIETMLTDIGNKNL